MTEPVEDFYSRNAAKYDDSHSKDNWSEGFRENLSEFQEKVEGTVVLDAGCGPGAVTEFLSKEGFEVTGIDIAEGMVEYARRNSEGCFKQMNILNLEFADAKFDGVWCGSTIFFLEKEGMWEALSEFRRVLKDEGVLYVDFKEGDGDFEKNKWDGEVSERRIPESEARRMLSEKGFQVLKFIEWENSRGANYLEFICRKK
ncbi:MAG: methyltransferase domain-containing protein [Candidatus Nanosalina sp.]